MRIDLAGITEKDGAEAEQFVKQLPIAKQDFLYVSDYRVEGVKAKAVSAVFPPEQSAPSFINQQVNIKAKHINPYSHIDFLKNGRKNL